MELDTFTFPVAIQADRMTFVEFCGSLRSFASRPRAATLLASRRSSVIVLLQMSTTAGGAGAWRLRWTRWQRLWNLGATQ